MIDVTKRKNWLRRASWCFALAGFLMPVHAVAGDWPGWRGPLSDGVSYESGLPDSAGAVLWRIPYGGRSTPVISNGRIYAINLAGQGVMEQERVLSVDLRTGRRLWEHRFNVFHTDIPNSRVGWASPVIDVETGNVYAHGVQGMFFCFSRDGGILWSRSLTETLGRISGYGGRTHTPIVDEDRVVISFLNSSFGSQARGGHRYLALDKLTGEILWWSEPGGKPLDTTYSMPVVSIVGGQRLLIAGNADGGIYAMQARTGKPVWGFQLSQRGINSSVVAEGNRVYACHSEENHDSTAMGRVVCIDATGRGDVTKTHEVWRQDDIPAGYASPAIHRGRLYVASNFGVLYCFDADTGRELWRHTYGRVGKGSPVIADGKIYVAGVNGIFAIIEDAGDTARALNVIKLHAEEGPAGEIFGSPGRESTGPREAELLARAKESVPEGAAVPALLQIRPGEILAKPADTVEFSAGIYDKDGRFLKTVRPEWSYRGRGGTISSEGGFKAVANAGNIGTIAAKLGGLSATARVRIGPELPIAEDF
ncbi:MAG: PQQ-binding-like beta-propeller repeat protein, partial [Planctomycetota bacterium]